MVRGTYAALAKEGAVGSADDPRAYLTDEWLERKLSQPQYYATGDNVVGGTPGGS